MVRTIGACTPENAKTVKLQIDRDLTKVENRVRHIQGQVPASGATTLKGDEALELVREMASDLQGLVDERTDSEVSG